MASVGIFRITPIVFQGLILTITPTPYFYMYTNESLLRFRKYLHKKDFITIFEYYVGTRYYFKSRLFRQQTPTAKNRPEMLWMCFLEQPRKQKNRASRYLHHQKAHFRQMGNHQKTLYSNHFLGAYLFFYICQQHYRLNMIRVRKHVDAFYFFHFVLSFIKHL